MLEFHQLEIQLQQLRPIVPRERVRNRCIQAAFCQESARDSTSWGKWLLAACILLVFSVWKQWEQQSSFAFYAKEEIKLAESDVSGKEFIEMAYSNRILLSSLAHKMKDKDTFLSYWEVPR